jgi:light-regulated signal transduction histidine kinase (bacteriophytochrome)
MIPKGQPGDAKPTPTAESTLESLRAEMRAMELRHAEEVRQFAYVVSHDLREHVRMIVSYTQLLERRYQQHLDEDGREFMRYIDDAVQRMEQLLSDLLNYSRQTGIPTEPPSRVDADLALQDALSRLEAALLDSGSQVTHDALPHVMFDFGRLTQMFRQLISNSIKFRGPEPTRIHIAASDAGHEVIFAVQDNGIGIDPRYHDQIFAMFKRLHGRQYPGNGIGLAICKRIVEQYGGRIWVESEDGKGAIFRFALPK